PILLFSLLSLAQLVHSGSPPGLWHRLSSPQCLPENLAVRATKIQRGIIECLDYGASSKLLVAQFDSDTRQCSLFQYTAVCHLIDGLAAAESSQSRRCAAFANDRAAKFLTLSRKLMLGVGSKLRAAWVMSDDADASRSNLVCGQTQQWMSENVEWSSEGAKLDGVSSKMWLENVEFASVQQGLTWLAQATVRVEATLLESYNCDFRARGGGFLGRLDWQMGPVLLQGGFIYFEYFTPSATNSFDPNEFVEVGVTSASPSSRDFFSNSGFVPRSAVSAGPQRNSAEPTCRCIRLGFRPGRPANAEGHGAGADLAAQMSGSSGYKCSLELNLELVSSPGTQLPNRDLLYVVVEAFSQAKRTRLLDAVFPLCVHERFRFERCFWTARDSREVADLLADSVVTVELRQVTDVYLGGCLLAYLKTDACNFFQPPTAGGSFKSGDRTLTLNRTVDFPGPGPRIEFDTRATIEELPGRSSGAGGSGLNSSLGLLNGDGNSRRPRTPGRPDRQTVSAALRTSKTPPPAARSRSPTPGRSGGIGHRPPFVVRHVDDSLVSRKPTLHDNFPGSGGGIDGDGEAPRRSGSRQRLRSTSPGALTKRRSRSAADGLDDSGFGSTGGSRRRDRSPDGFGCGTQHLHLALSRECPDLQLRVRMFPDSRQIVAVSVVAEAASAAAAAAAASKSAVRWAVQPAARGRPNCRRSSAAAAAPPAGGIFESPRKSPAARPAAAECIQWPPAGSGAAPCGICSSGGPPGPRLPEATELTGAAPGSSATPPRLRKASPNSETADCCDMLRMIHLQKMTAACPRSCYTVAFLLPPPLPPPTSGGLHGVSSTRSGRTVDSRMSYGCRRRNAGDDNEVDWLAEAESRARWRQAGPSRRYRSAEFEPSASAESASNSSSETSAAMTSPAGSAASSELENWNARRSFRPPRQRRPRQRAGQRQEFAPQPPLAEEQLAGGHQGEADAAQQPQEARPVQPRPPAEQPSGQAVEDVHLRGVQIVVGQQALQQVGQLGGHRQEGGGGAASAKVVADVNQEVEAGEPADPGLGEAGQVAQLSWRELAAGGQRRLRAGRLADAQQLRDTAAAQLQQTGHLRATAHRVLVGQPVHLEQPLRGVQDHPAGVHEAQHVGKAAQLIVGQVESHAAGAGLQPVAGQHGPEHGAGGRQHQLVRVQSPVAEQQADVGSLAAVEQAADGRLGAELARPASARGRHAAMRRLLMRRRNSAWNQSAEPTDQSFTGASRACLSEASRFELVTRSENGKANASRLSSGASGSSRGRRPVEVAVAEPRRRSMTMMSSQRQRAVRFSTVTWPASRLAEPISQSQLRSRPLIFGSTGDSSRLHLVRLLLPLCGWPRLKEHCLASRHGRVGFRRAPSPGTWLKFGSRELIRVNFPDYLVRITREFRLKSRNFPGSASPGTWLKFGSRELIRVNFPDHLVRITREFRLKSRNFPGSASPGTWLKFGSRELIRVNFPDYLVRIAREFRLKSRNFPGSASPGTWLKFGSRELIRVNFPDYLVRIAREFRLKSRNFPGSASPGTWLKFGSRELIRVNFPDQLVRITGEFRLNSRNLTRNIFTRNTTEIRVYTQNSIVFRVKNSGKSDRNSFPFPENFPDHISGFFSGTRGCSGPKKLIRAFTRKSIKNRARITKFRKKF
uniref:SPATA6 domain-containing protein n=1 Tax=Macrostomum lignano TaxID=282301 RepID=A0A1I8HSZ8_9PLAT